MKLLFFCLSFLIWCQLFGQTDSLQKNLHGSTYKGIAVLTKTDFERLPANNFMDLVYGAFPFLSYYSSVEEDYSFVVNGFVLINPNSINISQIERILFYPAGTLLTQGHLNRNGTFVIETRPEENRLLFITKTGMVIPGKDEMSSISKSGKGFLTSNEIGYQRKGKASFVSSSFSWLNNKSPNYSDVSANYISRSKATQDRIRISNFAGLEINKSWKLEGGAFFNYQRQNSRRETEYAQYYPLEKVNQKAEEQINYAGANASLIFAPAIQFRNIISVEAVYSDRQSEDYSNVRYSAGTNEQFKKYNGKFKTYAFSEHASFDVVHSAKVNLQASAVLRYYIKRTNQDSYYSTIQSGNLTSDKAYQKINRETFSASPSMHLKIREFISVQAGVTYDNYSHFSYGDNKDKKLLPNASLKLDLTSRLVNSKINSLTFYSSYYQSLNNYEKGTDKLDRGFESSPPPGAVLSIGTGAYTPSSNWVNSIALSGWKNRVAFEVAHTMKNKVGRFYVPLYGPGNNTVYEMVFREFGIRRLSFVVRTSVIAEENKNWSIAGVLYRSNGSTKNNPMEISAERDYLSEGNAFWNGGMKTSVELDKFFAQMSALFSFNKSGVDRLGFPIPDIDNYNMNFFLIGYKLPMKSKSVKSAEINIQCTNLLHSKEYEFDRYLGLGVHVNF